jgi:hypothetical protein
MQGVITRRFRPVISSAPQTNKLGRRRYRVTSPLPLRSSTTTSYPSPAACKHSKSRSPLRLLCVLLVLVRARGPTRHSVEHLSSCIVKVRVVGQRSCSCSARVRLHVIRFIRPTLVDHQQDLQLDLSDRGILSSKGVGVRMELCRASLNPRVPSTKSVLTV